MIRQATTRQDATGHETTGHDWANATEGNSDRQTSFILSFLLKPVIYLGGKNRHMNAKTRSQTTTELGLSVLDMAEHSRTGQDKK